MTSTADKAAVPLPSFHYEITMASRRAFQSKGSSAWALTDPSTARAFLDVQEPTTLGRVSSSLPPSPAGDSVQARFWAFYGVIGLVAQGPSRGSGPYQWFAPDGTPETPGPQQEGAPAPRFASGLVDAVAQLSSNVPAAFLRVDVVIGQEGVRVVGFSPKPAEASSLNPATDRRLGQLAVDAAGRLHRDLLEGKVFTAFQKAVKDASTGQVPNPAGSDSPQPTRQTQPAPGKNYTSWRLPHVIWESINAFDECTSLVDGVHTISLPSGVCVDVYLAGAPFASSERRPLLTFFAGAVTGREKKTGPFFTGLGIAKSLGVPLVSVADPTLDTHQELGLAWFTGRPNERVDDGIAAILASLARRAGRELLLVGGSGGGFAALKYAARLGSNCSVFVWNAQTDLLKYSPRFVRNYLSLAMNYSQAFLRQADWLEASRRRMEPGISTTVLEPGAGLRPRRLFFLQNAEDWHVGTHFLPWARANGFRDAGGGRTAADPEHVALVALAAPGHQPPPTALVTDIIRRLQDAECKPLDLAETSLGQEPLLSQDVSRIPALGLG